MDPGVRFFEVDLPVTITAKERVVTALLGATPAYVRYVPIDFSSQCLESALFQAGYDSARKSVFILEGVTMYITRAGNDATLAFIRGRSATGGTVVFDCVWREVIEGDYAGLYAASATTRSRWQPRRAFAR